MEEKQQGTGSEKPVGAVRASPCHRVINHSGFSLDSSLLFSLNTALQTYKDDALKKKTVWHSFSGVFFCLPLDCSNGTDGPTTVSLKSTLDPVVEAINSFIFPTAELGFK